VERANIEKGDLLFFNTSGSRISHVGIVHDITPEGEIKFIHASTSKGVIVSSLNERYWGARYRFAKRILTEERLEDNL
jgi:lipoprotein Spr